MEGTGSPLASVMSSAGRNQTYSSPHRRQTHYTVLLEPHNKKPLGFGFFSYYFFYLLLPGPRNTRILSRGRSCFLSALESNE